jgi:ATP-dependent protease HslVU (ClpYQ) peptidase subunit
MSVTRFLRFDAIGSGSSYALGAVHALYDGRLSAEEMARRACEAGMHFDIACGGEVDLFTVKAR